MNGRHVATSLPVISLIVPAWNEEALLPRLLDSVEIARRRLAAMPNGDRVEIIVADNGSTDATADIALARGCKVARVEKRVIAAARNGGAAVASGEVIAFVDADSMIHPDCFTEIVRAMRSSRIAGGATGVRMERMSLGIALTCAPVLPMVWLTGMDSGVVFCRRTDFLALGGFDEQRLVAEDIHFQWRLRRRVRARGERLVRLTQVKTITSTRKFDRHGEWHYFRQVPGLAWQVLKNRNAVAEFARRYWYDGR